MNKLVNIYPVYPVTAVNPPIRTTVRKVTKSDTEIRACIMARAAVEEILPNGKTITLTLMNYNTDNYAKPEEHKAEDKPVETSKAPEEKKFNNYYDRHDKKNRHNKFKNSYKNNNTTEQTTSEPEDATKTEEEPTVTDAPGETVTAETIDETVATVDLENVSV